MKNFYKNRKILVTGGTGMIGIQLVKSLVNLGAKVSVASLETNSALPKNVKHHKTDLTHLSNCIKITKGIDYVFHLAGIKGSPLMTKKHPFIFMTPMILFNTNMIYSAKINNIKRFLYTSSIGVYQPKAILKEDDVWKTQPSKNDWFSGWAKRIGELNAEACRISSKTKITIVRPANVFGPYDNFDPKTGMVVPSLISKFLDSKNYKVEVWGDGLSIRDFIYSKDVANAMLFIMKKNPTQAVNIGSGKGVKIRDLVNIINSYFDNKYQIIWNKNFPSGDKQRIMSINKLNKLGFKNRIDFKKNIFQTIDWFRKNRKIKRYDVFKSK